MNMKNKLFNRNISISFQRKYKNSITLFMYDYQKIIRKYILWGNLTFQDNTLKRKLQTGTIPSSPGG